MMKDFSKLKFLAIGANSFVCDCSLRDFIERAAFNAKVRQCRIENRKSKRSIISVEQTDPQYHYEVFMRKYHFYVSFADESCKNIVGANIEKLEKKSQKLNDESNSTANNCDLIKDDENQLKSTMNFNFLLLDYSENDYHCIESDGLSKRKVLFNDITECTDRIIRSTEEIVRSTPTYGGEDGENDNDKQQVPDRKSTTPNTLPIIYICVGLPLTILVAFWFWKRKDIKYFCSIFKNTLILSFDKEDKKALMMTNRRRKSNNTDNFTYDVFVSYCDKDREWVLDHLIPNIEKRSDITICLHERDFQVGASILENIISCMDNSKCLLLVISESFLKSNWCSFEMHLAQHR
jgi:TIR domain